MNRRRLLSSVLGVFGGSPPAAAQTGSVDGVFVNSAHGPVELVAYADRTSIGLLRVSCGTLEDVPAIEAPTRLLCNLPTWKPTLVWLSTRRIFEDEFAERRTVPFAVRRLNVAALEMRIADFEDPARVGRLLENVHASPENPAYLFITLDSSGVTRDYMIEVLRRP